MRNTFTLVSVLLGITASAQVSNGGFEAVIVPFDPELPTLPYNWTFGADYGAALVGDAHSGNYALSVWNWYWYAEGYASNGPNAWPGPEGLPITGIPDQLTGWYKRTAGDLEEGEDNSARVQVLLTRWNAATLQRDTVGIGEELFGEQATWAPFTLDIDHTSLAAPDTLVIQISSCVNCMCAGASTGECAYFQVDDLALNFNTGLSEALMDERSVRLLPQGDGSAVVRVGASTPVPFRLQLWDTLGRSVGEVQVRYDGQSIALPSGTGVVLFEARNGQGRIAHGRSLMP
ncbi:MAG TPA: hypothetical protein VGE21_09415 [Flavobacteriales bacterium]